ncbi:MAG: DNA modification methylase [Planctomycetota bacterium]|jgi:DNA modification methylase
MLIRDRIVELRRVPARELRPHPKNWRTHPPAQQEALRGILEEVGLADALLVREMPDGSLQLIDGHLRAETTPDQEVPVLVLDVTAEEADKLLASLDPLAGLAGTDPEKLRDLVADLETDSEALQAMFNDLAGFDRKEGRTDPDAIPDPPEEPDTQPGDLWLLGDHRLLCGDSASEADVDRLLDGAPIHLVNTDPPYNVRVEPRSNNAIAAAGRGRRHHQDLDVQRHPEKAQPTGRMRPRDRALENDFVSDAAFDELLRQWFGHLAGALLPGRAFYLWGGYSNVSNYPPAIVDAGLFLSQVLVWDKEHPVLTRKDFMGAHESAFYGWKPGEAHRFFGPANVSDLWRVKKVSPQVMVHLTEKPVELAIRAMEYSSKRGENVLDLFGGSGSTLIGAEQAGRRALLMEIDPLYCDVIVRRWEEFTGRKAERVGT